MRCLPETRRNRRGSRPCTAYVRVAGALHHAGQMGANAFRFGGRLKGHKLRPGLYRMTVVARDGAGAVSRARTARFRIVR